MLTDVQLRALGAVIEDALQHALRHPESLTARLLEMASQEVYQQLQARRRKVRAPA